MGDFNSHHTSWGCTDTNDKGRIIQDFITRHEIFPDLKWKVVDDFHGSDHFPIQVSVQQRPQRWNLHKANWEQFRVHCEQSIHPNAFEDSENPAELFNSLLYSAAEKSIPRTSTNPKHPNKPWFNDDCKKAIAERKFVLGQFNLRPTRENLAKFKIARAKARRTVKQNKRASWRQYVSRLNSRSSVKKTWDMSSKGRQHGYRDRRYPYCLPGVPILRIPGDPSTHKFSIFGTHTPPGRRLAPCLWDFIMGGGYLARGRHFFSPLFLFTPCGKVERRAVWFVIP